MCEGRCHCGKVGWRYDSEPEAATVCNCTICRRYGALWIYGVEGQDVHPTGPTTAYVTEAGNLEFHFCPTCGNLQSWRLVDKTSEPTPRMAVNVRLSAPETVAHLPIDHFDGLHSFEDLPRDGRRVQDYWF